MHFKEGTVNVISPTPTICFLPLASRTGQSSIPDALKMSRVSAMSSRGMCTDAIFVPADTG